MPVLEWYTCTYSSTSRVRKYERYTRTHTCRKCVVRTRVYACTGTGTRTQVCTYTGLVLVDNKDSRCLLLEITGRASTNMCDKFMLSIHSKTGAAHNDYQSRGMPQEQISTRNLLVQCLSTTHNLGQLGGNTGLASAVVLQSEAGDHVVCVVGGVVHCSHTG